MTLLARLTDLIDSIVTDYIQLRKWLTGSSTGDLSGLSTTAQGSLVEAINEVREEALSTEELGDPDADLVALYTAAKT